MDQTNNYKNESNNKQWINIWTTLERVAAEATGA